MKPLVISEVCDYRAEEDVVYRVMKKLLEPLERSWARLEKAKTVAVKSNQAYAEDRAVRWQGYYQDLVDPRVFRALIRILKERTSARIVLTDISVELRDLEGREHEAAETYTHRAIAEELGVDIAYGETPPYAWVTPPRGGSCLDRYLVPAEAAGADEIISLQKMKCHKFTGVTLSIKNLFGLTALNPYFLPRIFFHHFVRLPYMLADLYDVFDPALSVLDGLWSVSRKEWGGDPVVTNLLMAGDDALAVDAMGARLLGVDPLADLGQSIFRQERNLLKIAHDGELGTADPDMIDYRGDRKEPLGNFTVDYYWQDREAWEILRSTCEQGLYYAENEGELKKKYGGNYIFLRNKQCVWCHPEPKWSGSRADFPGEGALWLTYVPREGEQSVRENYAMYEETLRTLERGERHV